MMYILKLRIIDHLNHSAGLVSHGSHGIAPVFGMAFGTHFCEIMGI